MGEGTVRKRLCVLQVTPTHPNPDHVKFFNNDNCDFYFVTHDEPHEEAMQFCPNTTWTDTRNILAEKVPKNYDYYAFVDYDYKFDPKGKLTVLEQIIHDLNKFNPAILTYYPGKGLITPFAEDEEYFESHEYSIIPFTHCGLKIVHHSLMNWFFPMITNFGGGVEACHLFNIKEIPFLKHVVCSHKMKYDNGVTDFDAPHNQDGAWNDYRMSEMWKWIRPSFKKADMIDRYASSEQQKYHFSLVKEVFQKIFLDKKVLPLKSNSNPEYYDKNRLEVFFDLDHECFNNIDVEISKQLSPVSKNDDQKINKILTNISFSDLKTTDNPWIGISKKINNSISESRKISTSECVRRYQNINSKSLFYKSCSLDEKLKKYLEGKTVALVGPAPYMLGQSNGKDIDSHDVVVRIQHGIPNTKDYGTKTDIVQSCLNSNYGPPLLKYLSGLSVKDRPKFIISNDTVSHLRADGSWLYIDEMYQKVFKDLGIPLVHLKDKDSTWDRWALYWEIYPKQHIENFGDKKYTVYSANFNSGYGAANMLLAYPIKQLSVFGVDFYKTGIPQDDAGKYNKQYTDTYGKSGTPFGPDKMLHDQVSQIMHCKNVLLKDERFKLDKPVHDMLYYNNITQRIDKFIKLPKFKNETR